MTEFLSNHQKISIDVNCLYMVECNKRDFMI